MRMGPDDPRPLQVNGIIILQARYRIVSGVRVLKTQLIPMADGPCDVWRIGAGFIEMVLGVLHVVK